MSRFFKRAAAWLLVLMLAVPSALAQAETLNVLLIGVDTSSGDTAGRSDTMMLVQIDTGTGEIRLVSFLRDLYVAVPGHGRTRLNAAYFYGGEELLKETLQKNFDVRVDRTATVHFSVLAQLVDDVGGVEIELTEAERQHLNLLLQDYGNVPRVESAGVQRLNGTQALCYSRIRKLDSDFQRTSRQQTVIAAMLREVMQMDRWALLKLAVQNLGRVQTDLTLGDLTRLVPLAARLGETQLQTAHVPFEGTYTDETVNGMMVLVPNLQQNKTRLQDFLTD